jgi:hypothetical protein
MQTSRNCISWQSISAGNDASPASNTLSWTSAASKYCESSSTVQPSKPQYTNHVDADSATPRCRRGAEICYKCAQQPRTCGCSRDTLPPPRQDDDVDERNWCPHDVWQRIKNKPSDPLPWQCFHCKGVVRWGHHIWGRCSDHFWRCSGFHCRIELCDYCWEAEQANRALKVIQDFLASRRATA